MHKRENVKNKKQVRDSEMSDISGMVKNLTKDVEGIFDESILKKMEEARAERARLQAIQDESDIAATSYRVSAMEKEKALENMSELDSESVASRAFYKSQHDTEKKNLDNRVSRGSQAPFSTNRGGDVVKP